MVRHSVKVYLTTRIRKEKNLHRAFVKLLLKAPIRDVVFKGNRISLMYFGRRISDKITSKRVDHVGEWSRRRKEVFIDNKIDGKANFRALCVHELIEKFLVETFALKLDEEAHVVATQKGKEYLQSVGGNWRSHQELVYWDWRKRGKR